VFDIAKLRHVATAFFSISVSARAFFQGFFFAALFKLALPIPNNKKIEQESSSMNVSEKKRPV